MPLWCYLICFSSLFLSMLLACNLGSRPPDVILITVDTLRRDHVGVYNETSPALTPNIDSLAAEGVLYTDAFSPVSVTRPAFVSMMTGLEPGQHGVLTNLFRGRKPVADGGRWADARRVSVQHASGVRW